MHPIANEIINGRRLKKQDDLTFLLQEDPPVRVSIYPRNTANPDPQEPTDAFLVYRADDTAGVFNPPFASRKANGNFKMGFASVSPYSTPRRNR